MTKNIELLEFDWVKDDTREYRLSIPIALLAAVNLSSEDLQIVGENTSDEASISDKLYALHRFVKAWETQNDEAVQKAMSTYYYGEWT